MSCTFTVDREASSNIDDFFAAWEARFWSLAKHRLNAYQKAQAAAHAQRQAAHKLKQAAKAASNADPAARAARLSYIAAPIIERRRLGALKSICVDIAAKKGIAPAETLSNAVQAFAQIERAAALRAALKKRRAARVYPADGTAAHAASRYKAIAVEVVA